MPYLLVAFGFLFCSIWMVRNSIKKRVSSYYRKKERECYWNGQSLGQNAKTIWLF